MISSPAREETKEGVTGFCDPEDIVRSFGLEKGDHVADFGAGHGYFTIPIAHIVGNDGKVYALDIQRSELDIVKAKAKTAHLLNIEPVWGNVETPHGSHMKDAFIDFVIIANVLFQTEAKEAVLKEAHRVLRSGRKLAVIEWETGTYQLGPPVSLRVSGGTIKNLAMSAGFTFVEDFPAGSHHYGLLFKKQ